LKEGFIVEYSQKQIVEVDHLIEITYNKLSELKYSKATLKKFKYSFALFKTYADQNEIKYYTEALAFAFLEEYCKVFSKENTRSYHYQERKRAVAKLDEMYKYNVVSSRKLFSRKSYSFSGCLKNSIEAYIAYREKSLSKARLKSIKLYLEKFSDHISTTAGIHSENDLKTVHIIDFIKASSIYTHITLYTTIMCVKKYIQFLEKNQLLKENISSHIPRIPKRDNSLPGTFTKEESTALLNSIGDSTSKERRDYAMILLAARLGLRSSDIVNLKFANIDWKRNQISIVQKKTKTPIILPLLNDVGEAIINYLKNGRPDVNSQHIFIRESAPYTGVKASSLYTIVDGYVKRAKIKIPLGRKHGPHALRHSIATQLLNSNISISTIKEILSHKSTQTTKIYLKIAQKQLLECALEIPELNKDYTPTKESNHV
jgi:site-specific recombinase XerD